MASMSSQDLLEVARHPGRGMGRAPNMGATRMRTSSRGRFRDKERRSPWATFSPSPHCPPVSRLQFREMSHRLQTSKLSREHETPVCFQEQGGRVTLEEERATSHFYRAQPGFHREGSRKFRTTLIQVSGATEAAFARWLELARWWGWGVV